MNPLRAERIEAGISVIEDAAVRARVTPVLLMPPEFGIELRVSDTEHEMNGLWVREELLAQLVPQKTAANA